MGWLENLCRRLGLVTVPPGTETTLTWDFVDEKMLIIPQLCSGDPAHGEIAAQRKIPGKRSKAGEGQWSGSGCALGILLNLILLPFGFIFFPSLWSQEKLKLDFNHSAPYCAECQRGIKRTNTVQAILIVLVVLASIASCVLLPVLFSDVPDAAVGLSCVTMAVFGIVFLAVILLFNKARSFSNTVQIVDFDPMGQYTQVTLCFLNRDYAAIFGFENSLRALQYDPRPDARQRAAQRLGLTGDRRATLLLVAALGDRERAVREAAVAALTRLQDPEAVEPLVRQLQAKEVGTRLAAASVFKEWGGAQATGALIAALAGDDSAQVRLLAAGALAASDTGTSAGEGAVASLIAALGDQDEKVRARAARSLEALQASQAVPHLVAVFGDPSDAVRQAAARALGALHDLVALDPLIAAVQDPSAAVRQTAADALQSLAPEHPLVQALHALVHGEPDARAQAAAALGELQDERAIPALRRALGERGPVQDRAAAALVRFGPDRVFDLFVGALDDPEDRIRTLAAWALGQLGDSRAEKPLLYALRDPVDQVRRSAAEALAMVSPPDFRPAARAICTLLTGQAEERLGAARQLAELGERRATIPLRWTLHHDPEVNVRLQAARTLSGFGVPAVDLLVRALGTREEAQASEVLVALGTDVVPSLIEAARTGEEGAQLGAIKTLVQIEDDRTVPLLVSLAQDAAISQKVRLAAVRALREEVQHPAVVPCLIQALGDSYHQVRIVAAETLGQTNDPRAVEPLIQALEDWQVRNQAAQSLTGLGDLATEALLARYHSEKNKKLRNLIGNLLGDKKPTLMGKLFGRKEK